MFSSSISVSLRKEELNANSKRDFKKTTARTSSQSSNDNAGFFININEYVDDIQSEKVTSLSNIDDSQIQVTSFYTRHGHNNLNPSDYSTNTSHNETNQEEVIKVINLCKTQMGCRKLQNLIYTDKDKGNTYLYPLLKPGMLELINDQFGNYLYQQFLDILYPDSLEHLILFIFNNFNSIAFSPNGTRIIQKLIENISYGHSALFLFVYELLYNHLRNNIAHIAVDENANHIVQKMIICLKSPHTNFIYEEILTNFIRISTTKYGCCVIQKCLSHGNQEQKDSIILSILNNTYHLIVDQFGNYVYQSLIFTNDDRVILEIYKIIAPNFIMLCKQKYSSNVIEKLFEINNKVLVNKIATLIYENEDNVIELLTDQYGNYIIQKILDCINNKEITQIILYTLLSNVDVIYQKSFGKSLLTKLARKHVFVGDYLHQQGNSTINVLVN